MVKPLMMRPLLPCLLLITSASCAPKTLTQDELRQGPLSYLQNGQTTREEAILKLGIPSADFESGRILTYRIAQEGEQGVTVMTRQSLPEAVPQDATHVNFSLVLVFDDKGVLMKQSLVPIKSR